MMIVLDTREGGASISSICHNYILSHLRLQANAGRLDSDDLQVVNQLLE